MLINQSHPRPRVVVYALISYTSEEEMPTDAAKKRQQKAKKLAGKGGGGGKGKGAAGGASIEPGAGPAKPTSHRSCTSVLTSHPLSRDLHIERLSLTFHGAELLSDAKLELNCGRRYGLVGLNGSGELWWALIRIDEI